MLPESERRKQQIASGRESRRRDDRSQYAIENTTQKGEGRVRGKYKKNK